MWCTVGVLYAYCRLNGLLLADDLRIKVQREALCMPTMNVEMPDFEEWPALMYVQQTSAQDQQRRVEQRKGERKENREENYKENDDGMCPIGVWDPREAAIALGDPNIKQPLMFAQPHSEWPFIL